MNYAPTLILDFDGVLHLYTSPWAGADRVLDGPVPGAMDFIIAALPHFKLAISSSRSHEPGGIAAMRGAIHAWMLEHVLATKPLLLSVDQIIGHLDFPLIKPPAFLTIDDRALTFTGLWPDPKALLEFRPWNKRVVVVHEPPAKDPEVLNALDAALGGEMDASFVLDHLRQRGYTLAKIVG